MTEDLNRQGVLNFLKAKIARIREIMDTYDLVQQVLERDDL